MKILGITSEPLEHTSKILENTWKSFEKAVFSQKNSSPEHALKLIGANKKYIKQMIGLLVTHHDGVHK